MRILAWDVWTGACSALTACTVEDASYLTGQVLQPNGGWVMA